MLSFFLVVLLSTWAQVEGFETELERDDESPNFDYEDFNRHDDITRELMRLQVERPHVVKMIEIGRTHENRAINVVKISGDRRSQSNVVSMWIDAGIHAREWISISTAMYFIHELITLYDTDFTIYDLLNRVDFYILPVANPDGYEYTHTKDRCWRKNRRPMKCSFDGYNSTCCAGVDLNRNYDWYFGTKSSGPPCEDTYPGPYPSSEPETVAIVDFISNHEVKAVVSMHICGQLMLTPYGHLNDTYSPNYHEENELAQRAANALYREYSTEYRVGTAWEVGYESSGISMDWIKGKLHVPYVYTFELRDQCIGSEYTCEKSFVLPKTDIRPTGLETFEAIKVIATEMIKLFG